MTDRIDTAKERDELLNLIKCAIEFCNLAAGEGISIDNLSPEDFLFYYSSATGYEDWCTISDYVIDQIKRDGREIERLRKSTEYDADAAKGMTAKVDLWDGAVATIIDPRSFTDGGPEWVMRYGNPNAIRFVVASLLESYDGLLSCHIPTKEAVRRLRKMRNARAALKKDTNQ